MKTAVRTFILAVSLKAAVLQAATIQSSNTFDFYNPTSTTYNSITNSGSTPSTVTQTFNRDSTTILLEKFNTMLGTLNSVTYTVTFTTSETSGYVTNPLVGVASSATIARTITLSVDLPAYGSSPVATSATNTYDAGGLLNLGSGNKAFNNIAGPGPFGSSAITSSPQLAAVSASSPGQTYGVHLTSSDLYTLSKLVSLVGSSGLTGRTHYVGSVTATYNYTPIPEPSALWLLIGGLGASLVGRGAFRRALRRVSPDAASVWCK